MNDSIFDDANLLKHEIEGGTGFALNLFKLVHFTLQVNQLSDEEFEKLCRTTRSAAVQILRSHNEKAQQLSPAQARVLERGGKFTELVDTTTVMRYISEIEAHLRKSRVP